MMWYIRPMTRQSKLVFAIAATCLIAVNAAAQPRRATQNDPDMAELAAYRLNTATLQKVIVATQAFAQALQNDPKYKGYVAAQNALKALQAKEEPTPADETRIEKLEAQLEQMSDAMDRGGDAQTLADMERKINAMPHMPEALAKAALSPREYAKFNLSLIQAGFLAGMKKAGQLKLAPPGVSMENVQFVIDHEKEIAELGAQMTGK
jgi:hypothetical protein